MSALKQKAARLLVAVVAARHSLARSPLELSAAADGVAADGVAADGVAADGVAADGAAADEADGRVGSAPLDTAQTGAQGRAPKAEATVPTSREAEVPA